MSQDPNATRVRANLRDPVALCGELGLLDGSQRQAGGVLIRCPAHMDNTPSCSVTLRDDKTIGVKCFGCNWGADAIGLVGMARGLTRYRDQLEAAAAIAGVYLEDSSPQNHAPRAPLAIQPQRPQPEPEPVPSREYPPESEVLAMWNEARPVGTDVEAAMMLLRRKIDAGTIADDGQAKVLHISMRIPAWARFKGSSWLDTGHRLILPVYDSKGALRSVRAWRVTDGDSPKRLPPSGHAAQGLVLANARARALLTAAPGQQAPQRKIVMVEGEPDFLTWAAVTRSPLFGIMSGGWTQAHAERIPFGSDVYIRTHRDQAGDKYAAEIAKTLKGIAVIHRMVADGKFAA